MFSGIIEDIGEITGILEEGKGRKFWIGTSLPIAEIRLGDSLCVDGCCLTVTQTKGRAFEVFASHETLEKTTLGGSQKSTLINLERSLSLGARIDGHMVQGHVEARGKIVNIEKVGDSVEISVEIPRELSALVVPKGSIAIDGISLTVNSVQDKKRECLIGMNLIPFTLTKTTLGKKKTGDRVNLETDILGRYVQRQLQVYSKNL